MQPKPLLDFGLKKCYRCIQCLDVILQLPQIGIEVGVRLASQHSKQLPEGSVLFEVDYAARRHART